VIVHLRDAPVQGGQIRTVQEDEAHATVGLEIARVEQLEINSMEAQA
jgi:hypothetical protein